MLVSRFMQSGISTYAYWYLYLCKAASQLMRIGISVYAFFFFKSTVYTPLIPLYINSFSTKKITAEYLLL
ncbi:hypothetical protein VIBNISOn1_1840062 [Vibrio nigripulchritudo SOn1]|uniref:Uncharacterized protein n=1 Tax=Vibrio nigripulchritudo SOn1 TaxID=1238450 RepID=A0AAV2VQJ8_9VIBR|nr:hypothetical protein VIBNISOn1_1840062 [Vibrio nigripulchritudo SOn1]